MKKLFFTLPLLSLTALASPDYGRWRSVEWIFGAWPSRHGISFQVPSNGCTSKGNFRIQRSGRRPVQIQLVRIGQDLCRAYLPNGIRLNYSWSELGLPPGAQVVITNPRRGRW